MLNVNVNVSGSGSGNQRTSLPMSTPRIGVVISTTREGRFGDKPAAWITGIGNARDDMQFEIIDLRDYVLPLYGDADDDDVEGRFRARIAGMDGLLFVTAEYNHSIPGTLKNALDYGGQEFHRKPAAFVGYGGVGAARAIEHLRTITVELRMAPMRTGVYIATDPMQRVRQGEAGLNDFGFLVESANAVLDELAWWTVTLKAGREAATGVAV